MNQTVLYMDISIQEFGETVQLVHFNSIHVYFATFNQLLRSGLRWYKMVLLTIGKTKQVKTLQC